jgi:hypothetical protein
MHRSLLPVALLLAATAETGAVDHPIAGDKLFLKDDGRRVLRFISGDDAVDPGLADPRAAGATLTVQGSGAGDGSAGPITLDGGLWKGLGQPAGSKGYKFLDRAQVDGVRKVVLKPGKLVIVGGGANWPYAVTQPQGTIDVRFEIGGETFCALFASLAENEAGFVLGRDAPPPTDCGGPAVCGDGLAQGSEECDDGNTGGGDGCSGSCQLENAGALCAGVPAASGTALDSVRVASGLSQPTHITAPRLDPRRVFVVEQPGRIRIIKDGTLLGPPFLDIEDRVSCCGERGLLSLAFHPDYEANGRFFVNYTDNAGDTVLARYQVSGNPDVADDTSEQILLTIEQPFANHNGGQIAFGPDGHLYCGMGDGGSGGDPLEAGQDDATLLGKMLRLDVAVESAPYYAVPPSNPNPGAGDPLGLIWAKGLRNPWRFSFDRGTGDLYVADVGQGSWEEVNVVAAGSTGGENYGWDIFEGTSCFEPDPLPDCPDPPVGFTAPVLEYSHGQGCSVTGGFVYRGCRMPDLHGTYFYADYCTAFVRTFAGVVGGSAQNPQDRTADVAPGGGLSIDNVTSFGEDARGELYIADQGGEIFKIVPGS